MEPTSVDDLSTLAALGVIAFALADVSHEALGHGLATLVVGGRAVLLTTCNFDSSGHYSKWIPAAGGLVNLAVGLGSLSALRLASRIDPLSRFFLVLLAAFNLFFAFGYPAYSGVARFGDWAAVISGFDPQWPWRVLLIVVSVAGYYASMILVARAIAPFAATAEAATGRSPGSSQDRRRVARIALVPYIAAMIMASIAGALNPGGWLVMFTAGLPSAAAAFGLTQMDRFLGSRWVQTSHEVIPPMQRSLPWIVAAFAVAAFFVGVLGPGIRFR